MSVDTTAVANRRAVRYSSLEDLLADAEKTAAGPTQALGNWSPGQIYQHIALVMHGCLDGFAGVKLPWYIRAFGWLFKKKILTGKMPAGYKLTRSLEEKIGPPPTSTEDGLAFLKKNIARLQTEPQRHASPFLGKLTRAEWDQLHLRHAELHMSFLVPA